MNDFRDWIYEVAKHPIEVGAVFRSSDEVAKEMVEPIPEKDEAQIVEVGPGDGSITDVLVKEMNGAKLDLVEINKQFVSVLKEKYSILLRQGRVQVHNFNGLKVDQLEPKTGKVDCIISSIPLNHFSSYKSIRFLLRSHNLLLPGGVFVQLQNNPYYEDVVKKIFTGNGKKEQKQRDGEFKVKKVGSVWPTSIYVGRKNSTS